MEKRLSPTTRAQLFAIFALLLIASATTSAQKSASHFAVQIRDS